MERLQNRAHCRVLEVGSGSGRNTAALVKAGFAVCAIADEDVRPFDAGCGFHAALSTHALLHGTPRDIAGVLAAIARALEPEAPFYATFGSTRDARFGKGARIEEHTFAPEAGDETGVPHAFFDEPRLLEMLEGRFEIEALEERAADEMAGRWAHAEPPKGTDRKSVV